jgi:hypothetical protein
MTFRCLSKPRRQRGQFSQSLGYQSLHQKKNHLCPGVLVLTSLTLLGFKFVSGLRNVQRALCSATKRFATSSQVSSLGSIDLNQAAAAWSELVFGIFARSSPT